MHACTQQFVDRTSASVRLFDSFVNLDSCVEDGFFFFFGAWIRRIRPIFSLPQLALDLRSTPTIPDSCRQRSSISLTAVPRNHVEHFFRKACQLWTRSKLPSPYQYFEKRKKKTTRPKFFSTQSTVSPLHAPSSAGTCCLHVLSELGRGAESFLATEIPVPFLYPDWWHALLAMCSWVGRCGPIPCLQARGRVPLRWSGCPIGLSLLVSELSRCHERPTAGSGSRWRERDQEVLSGCRVQREVSMATLRLWCGAWSCRPGGSVAARCSSSSVRHVRSWASSATSCSGARLRH